MAPTTLLFIDDNKYLEYFYQAVKAIDRSIHCLLHTNSETALETLADEGTPSPDLIFIDMKLHLSSGGNCLERIRQMVRHRSTPVIICSDRGSDKTDINRLGTTWFFTKPFTASGVKNKLAPLLFFLL